MQSTICTAAGDYQKFFATPPAPAAYPTLPPTVVAPGGDGIINIGSGGQNPYSFATFAFFAAGTATSAFNVKILGWKLFNGEDWFPFTLADLNCTLGSTVRSFTTDKMVSGITVNGGLIVPNYQIVPADGGIQYIQLDLSGVQRVQLVPGTKTGTVTTINGGMSGF